MFTGSFTVIIAAIQISSLVISSIASIRTVIDSTKKDTKGCEEVCENKKA